MSRILSAIPFVSAAVVLAGCVAQQPSDPVMVGGPVAPATAPAAQAELLAGPGESPYSFTTIPGTPTGTVVGERVEEIVAEVESLEATVDQLANELAALQDRTKDEAADYFDQVAQINTKLQAGTTPSNPRVIAQHEAVAAQLDALARDVARITRVGTDIANSGSVASFLRDSTRAAFNVPGAVDEDHEALTRLEDRIDGLILRIGRQLEIAREEVAQQSASVASEQRNLQALSIAIAHGGFYDETEADESVTSNFDDASVAAQTMAANGERALISIRFDRSNVAYEETLEQVIEQALQRNSEAAFEIVAVSPASGASAERAKMAAEAQSKAEDVLRAINAMGVAPSRLNLAATTSVGVDYPEVRVLYR